ncbi:MAG TPA: F0F1 ATP synthase subunit A [Pyrinomonadaceae bacterium]|jgi:F-type H+-transporting ATPase subunit a
MFWLLQHEGAGQAAEHAAAAGEPAAHAAEHGGEHVPWLVTQVNHLIGESLYHLQLQTTKPFWDKFFGAFGTNAEAVFGPYSPETAVPWYTVMFLIACLLTVVFVWVLKGKLFGRALSEDEPHGGQQTLEVAVLAVRGLIEDIIGPHGLKYFPVVATFAILILVSNLMGLFPLFMSPTSSTSVTFALGISSFVYYNYIGIKENGLLAHLGHFAGVHYFSGAILWIMGPAMFVIELISNFVRPLSLGLRLFGNIFGDEQVGANIANLAPPYTLFVIPAVLMILSVFAAVMQTFIFTLLSMIYIGEVSHAPHEDHHDADVDGEEIIAPVFT